MNDVKGREYNLMGRNSSSGYELCKSTLKYLSLYPTIRKPESINGYFYDMHTFFESIIFTTQFLAYKIELETSMTLTL